MNKWLALFLFMPVVLLAAQSTARQKAGLWDVSVVMQAPDEDSEIGGVLAELGLEIPDAEPVLYQVCVTPEQAALDKIPTGFDPDSGCRLKNSQRSGNRYTADAVCSGRLHGQGKVQGVLHNAESFSGTLKFSGTTSDGIPVVFNGMADGRWQGADCRGVEPYELPPERS